jgi:peptide/nickel transport system ATP-binding protein
MKGREPVLKIKNLSTGYEIYEGFLKVLNQINIEVYPGEKVGLVGETGCGKTTTMKSVMQILPKPNGKITSGSIYFEGKDLLKLKEKQLYNFRKQYMSAIFQNPSAALNPVFTVGQQLRDAIKYSSEKKLSKEEINRRAIQVLTDVALPDPERLLDNYPIQLSGGMRQRICIALALVTASKLLIADEPGTSLDVTIQDQILKLLMNLVEERGTATIYITHSLGVVREWMDRVYVMYAGNIIEMAKTKELFDNPIHPYTRGLMKAVPKLSGGGITKGIPGRVPEYLNPPSGCRFSPRCDYSQDICHTENPELIEISDGHFVACHFRGEFSE